MPTLNWIGKDKIVNHDKEVPFRLLKKNKQLSLGTAENLIVEGDNLEALKALMPFYHGKIKCIYIDPPYNTGNEKWVYNDKVNSPKIREWLGRIVDIEDLTRHDKWLCMMYPRLKLLRELLVEEGIIFISIDDNEYTNLKIVLNELYGEDNYLGTIIWQTATDNNPSQIAIQHEYVLTYAKNKLTQPKWIIKNEGARIIQERYEILRDKYKKDVEKIQKELRSWMKENKDSLRGVLHYSYVDGKGVYYPDNPSNPHPGGYKFKVLHPATKKICRVPPNGYRWPEGTFNEFLKEGNIEFGENETITPKPKKRLSNAKELLRSVYYEDNRRSTNELAELMGKKVFENPKSPRLIKHLLNFTVSKEDIILDSFAGSGTTGQAVLDLNKEDDGNRKFILVEMEKDICRNITAERVRRVAKGYSYKKNGGEAVKAGGLGNGFEYVELGETLFDSNGAINQSVSFKDMASYVFFTETHTNLDKNKIKENYIGEFAGTYYFLLFDGIGKNILDRNFLKKLKAKEGKKIVYADKCLLDEEILEKHQIIFKQIPYQVTVY